MTLVNPVFGWALAMLLDNSGLLNPERAKSLPHSGRVPRGARRVRLPLFGAASLHGAGLPSIQGVFLDRNRPDSRIDSLTDISPLIRTEEKRDGIWVIVFSIELVRIYVHRAGAGIAVLLLNLQGVTKDYRLGKEQGSCKLAKYLKPGFYLEMSGKEDLRNKLPSV